jgi:mono/diheme cytochrome c family protein
MKRAGAVLAALSMAALVACSSSSYKPDSQDGGTIFMEACRPCHAGPSSPGGGLAGRNLTARQVVARLQSGGRGMPAFPGISGEARDNLVRFVVGMSRPQGDAP